MAEYVLVEGEQVPIQRKVAKEALAKAEQAREKSDQSGDESDNKEGDK